jgi:hypothetical protein
MWLSDAITLPRANSMSLKAMKKSIYMANENSKSSKKVGWCFLPSGMVCPFVCISSELTVLP